MQVNNVTTNYQLKNNSQVKKSNNAMPSFKANPLQDVAVNGLTDFYTGLAKTNPFQKFAKSFSQSNKSFIHLMVAESVILSGFYMINTLRNKKIDKEQKPQMLINDTLTLGVSAAGAYFIDDKVSSIFNKGVENYFGKHAKFYMEQGKNAAASSKGDLLGKVSEVVGKNGDDFVAGLEQVAKKMGSQLKGIVGEEGKLKTFQMTEEGLKTLTESVKQAITNNAGNAEKAKESVKGLVDDVYNSAAARAEADKVLPGFNKLRVILVLGLIYRYLGPVVITPIANKISSIFFNKKGEQKAQKA